MEKTGLDGDSVGSCMVTWVTRYAFRLKQGERNKSETYSIDCVALGCKPGRIKIQDHDPTIPDIPISLGG